MAGCCERRNRRSKVHRLRELGGASKAAVAGIERGTERLGGLVQDGSRREGGVIIRRAHLHRGAPEQGGELLGGAVNGVSPLAVGLSHALQHTLKARHPVAVNGREIGAAVERLAVRREEDGHRPAAVLGQRLHRLHVDRVEVGALFAVHFDVDEQVVHQPRRRLVLERLPLHYMAPMAGRVANREQDRLVQLAGLL